MLRVFNKLRLNWGQKHKEKHGWKWLSNEHHLLFFWTISKFRLHSSNLCSLHVLLTFCWTRKRPKKLFIISIRIKTTKTKEGHYNSTKLNPPKNQTVNIKFCWNRQSLKVHALKLQFVHSIFLAFARCNNVDLCIWGNKFQIYLFPTSNLFVIAWN